MRRRRPAVQEARLAQDERAGADGHDEIGLPRRPAEPRVRRVRRMVRRHDDDVRLRRVGIGVVGEDDEAGGALDRLLRLGDGEEPEGTALALLRSHVLENLPRTCGVDHVHVLADGECDPDGAVLGQPERTSRVVSLRPRLGVRVRVERLRDRDARQREPDAAGERRAEKLLPSHARTVAEAGVDRVPGFARFAPATVFR